MRKPAPIYCPKCQTRLIVRSGSRGKFIACPKSNKGDNHGTWDYRPAADPDPCASNLSYPPRQQEREDYERDSIPSARGLRDLCEQVAREQSDPDLEFLRATAGVAGQLRALQGGQDPGVDVFLDPQGAADYAIASALHDAMYEENCDDPLAAVFNVGLPRS